MQVHLSSKVAAIDHGSSPGQGRRGGGLRWPWAVGIFLALLGLALGFAWMRRGAPGNSSRSDEPRLIQRLEAPWMEGSADVWVESDAVLEVRGPVGHVGTLTVGEPATGETQHIPFKIRFTDRPTPIPIPRPRPGALHLSFDPSSHERIEETVLIIASGPPHTEGEGSGSTEALAGQAGTGELDGPGLAGSMAGRNVLLILTDALHASHMGIYGGDRPTTPFLDQLARTGVLFEQTYAQSSWTIPSVATIFTSLEQEVHGVLTPGDAWLQEHPTLAEAFQDGGYTTHAIIQNGVVSRDKGYAEGFDTFEYCPGGASGIHAACELALETLAHEDGPPQFVYLHLLPPHGPVDVPDPTASRFDPEYTGAIVGSVQDSFELNERGAGASDADTRHLRALYDEWLAICDARLGRTFGPLLRGPAGEKLLILHTSDHGEAFMQHDRQGHCDHVYEEMVRVPWILVAPDSDLPRGMRLPGRTSLLDIYPTLLELAGIDAPRVGPRGHSRVPWIEGRARAAESPLVLSARYRTGGRGPQQAILVDGFKWVRSDGSKRTTEGGALYDLGRDPGEERDVQGDHPVLSRALDGRLEAWLATHERHRDEVGHAAMRRAPDEEELRTLEMLGYVDGGGSPSTEGESATPAGTSTPPGGPR